ncbi:hypothetical protein BKA67DRAFT_596201 [Truncatella angustata]|uniref:Uncharacterized protein n=1 Tax=Truncatella angustata TaxID=152316 RepID=A0A9P8UB21_9PEZI|nr:uncharacterized protein BKA67DRAFT_596201 [Truncatella angustata]KAH6643470.1 hypothetical protein BKA67DRAFT_596201 [Truncatella angustata]
MSLSTTWTQFFTPRNGAPPTENSLPKQAGKVFIVTDELSGLGYELSRILYGAGSRAAIRRSLRLERPNGRPDVLFSNAGTSALKNDHWSRKGHEYHFAIKSLGATAKTNPKDTIRVVWLASFLVKMGSPKAAYKRNSYRIQQVSKRRMRNLGNYVTNIWRITVSMLYYILWPTLHDPVHGDETADSVAGRYAICNGRWHPGQREDLVLF